jgi:hypothetical protein
MRLPPFVGDEVRTDSGRCQDGWLRAAGFANCRRFLDVIGGNPRTRPQKPRVGQPEELKIRRLCGHGVQHAGPLRRSLATFTSLPP